jgi:hypothetical protein
LVDPATDATIVFGQFRWIGAFNGAGYTICWTTDISPQAVGRF